VLELEALELPETDVEAVLALVVALELVATELEVVVVIGRIYPAILVLSRLAVLAKD
jgi:hypothetical protein